MKPWPTSKQARERLKERAAETGDSLASMSRLIGKPSGYLSNWVRTGKPEWLESADRNKLARFLGIEEIEIGWPDAD